MLAPKLTKLALALLTAACLHAEVKVLKNFTLIDGTGKAPAAGSAMIITDGKISWVGPVGQLKAPAGAETVDLAGKFVLPGLIDMHGHIGNTVDLVENEKFHTRENVLDNLHTYAMYGVTTVHSMGTDKDLMFQIRDEQRKTGRPSVARVYSAGQGFVFQGGYGGLVGTNNPYSKIEDIEPAVAKLAAKKVDLIKLWLDDEFGKFPKMPPAMSKAVIDAAHKHGLRAVAHIFYLEDAKRLAEQGINGFVHSVRDKPVDQALIDMMKQKGIWELTPTVAREESKFIYAKTPPFAGDPFFQKGVSAASLKLINSPERQKTMAADPQMPNYPKYLEMAKQNLKKLYTSGVKVGFGTDTGPPGRFPGYFDHWELEEYVSAGLTPMQALTAATRDSAEFLGAKDLGVVEANRWADLLVVNANPLTNIKNSRQIHSVYIAGSVVK